MAMTVYAKAPYIYAYASRATTKKVAKIPGGTPLLVITEFEGWYEVAKLATGQYDSYPDEAEHWWVDPEFTLKSTVVTPTLPVDVSSNVSDIEAAAHIVAIIRWLKEM